MTTDIQKLKERGYVELIRKGQADWVNVVPGERPDFRIKRSSGPDIALEVVEYHAESRDVPGTPRVAVEARWWKELWPVLDRERHSKEALRGFQVRVGFGNKGLPHKRDHHALAQQLVQVVEAAVLAMSGREVDVVFLPQAFIDKANRLISNKFFLAQEVWPLAAERLSSLSVSSWPFEVWPLWNCLDVMGAWGGADEDKFKAVLEKKAKKAEGYDAAGAVLWLLVVCETHDDLESHIYPRDNEELLVLEEKVRESGVADPVGPYAEVWLLSAFTGSACRLRPSKT
jgi:hypothetical protein